MEAVQSLSTQPKPNEIALVPYVELDQWTISEELLRDAFEQITEEGTRDRVFYDGGVRTADQFIEMLRRPSNIPVFLFMEGRPIGFAWLNSQIGHIAFAHFCFMKSIWGSESERAGRLLIKYWMALADKDGPVFDVLIGVIPVFNSPAIQFTQRVGFTLLGNVPSMARLKSGHNMEAAVLYYARGEHGRKECQ